MTCLHRSPARLPTKSPTVSYRLLCVARGDAGPLPRFDEQAYAAVSNAGRLQHHLHVLRDR